MEQKPRHRYIDLFYELGLFIKGASAVLEVAAGILTIFITQSFVVRIAEKLTQDELYDDPKDFFSLHLLQAAHQFSIASKAFIVIYLLSHGIVRLALVIGLLKKKLIAYRISFWVFGAFIAYQLYRYSHTRSVWLLGLSIFDAFFLWLIWKEYAYVRGKSDMETPENPQVREG